jgi:hypothetical protein
MLRSHLGMVSPMESVKNSDSSAGAQLIRRVVCRLETAVLAGIVSQS